MDYNCGLSEPVMQGSVQVAGNGVATVLLADHQTTGGTPRSPRSLDLAAFAQPPPRDHVGFLAVTPQQALAHVRLRAATMSRYLAALASARGTFEQKELKALSSARKTHAVINRIPARRKRDDPVTGAGTVATTDRGAKRAPGIDQFPAIGFNRYSAALLLSYKGYRPRA